MSNLYTSDITTQVPPSPKNNNRLILMICLGIGGFMFIFCGGVLAGILIPAIYTAREAAIRVNDVNNMRQIAQGILNYEAAYKMFPPAYTVDEQGNKLHSWRSLILPFIGQSLLYEQIDFSQPWDSPANANARSQIVSIYQGAPAHGLGNQTLFHVVVDPSSLFPGASGIPFRDLTDGASNTVLLVAADRDKAVHWMEPRDITLNEFANPAPKGAAYRGGTLITLANGEVEFLAESVPYETRKAIVTRKAGELITFPDLKPDGSDLGQ